jgi:hypothetical protein
VPTGDPLLPLLADTSLNLCDVIILDNASSVDVFCNPDLVTNITRSPKNKHLLGNGGSLTARYTSHLHGCHQDVWFCKKAVTNIIGLRNLTKQFRVQYDSDNQTFVVDRSLFGLPAMHFRLHHCGLYFFTPPEGQPFSFGVPSDDDLPTLEFHSHQLTGVPDEWHLVTRKPRLKSGQTKRPCSAHRCVLGHTDD